MNPPIISATHLRKTYGKGAQAFEALRGVSLDVARGESLAIVGKSGSGKSTLMHILALMDSPSSGSLAIDGTPVADLTAVQLNHVRNRQFGFVFQQFFLSPHQTVLENVMLPLAIAGVGRSERRRRAMVALEQLDLADKARNRAVNLSGGQKQRVVIARALVNQPPVLFADEPTGNLDSATGENVEDVLFRLQREHGITLVVVTHDDDLASRCERRLTVRDGLIAASHDGSLSGARA